MKFLKLRGGRANWKFYDLTNIVSTAAVEDDQMRCFRGFFACVNLNHDS